MNGDDREQPRIVSIGKCLCPDTPHPNDWVQLRPKPNLEMGLAVRAAIRQSGWLIGDTESAYVSVMVRYGVEGWNVRDAEGPVRVTTTAVAERLGWGDGALAVAEAAQEMYGELALAPLVPTKSDSAPATPEENSTSPSPSSGAHSRTSSVPSSPSGSATGA